MTNYFMSLGYDFNSATHRAFALISGLVSQQAAMLTYKEMFQDIGLFFICLIPLLFMFYNKKKPVETKKEQTEWTLE